MAAAATISHAAPGRLRVRFPAGMRGAAQLSHVERGLRAAPMVRRATANQVTHAILVEFDGAREDLLSYAREHELFDVEAKAPARAARAARREHPRRPPPHVDARETLEHLGAFALFGLAAYQAWKGKFLPAGLPMIFQGLAFLEPRRTEFAVAGAPDKY